MVAADRPRYLVFPSSNIVSWLGCAVGGVVLLMRHVQVRFRVVGVQIHQNVYCAKVCPYASFSSELLCFMMLADRCQTKSVQLPSSV